MIGYLKEISDLFSKNKDLREYYKLTSTEFSNVKSEISNASDAVKSNDMEKIKQSCEFFVKKCNLVKNQIGKSGVIWKKEHAEKLKRYVEFFFDLYEKEKKRKEEEIKEEARKAEEKADWLDATALYESLCESYEEFSKNIKALENAKNRIQKTDYKDKPKWVNVFETTKKILELALSLPKNLNVKALYNYLGYERSDDSLPKQD